MSAQLPPGMYCLTHTSGSFFVLPQLEKLRRLAVVSVGRDESNDLCMPSEQVSRRHALVLCDPFRGGYSLVDRNSSNGTFLNVHQRLDPGDSVALSLGDMATFGDSEHSFVLERLDGHKAAAVASGALPALDSLGCQFEEELEDARAEVEEQYMDGIDLVSGMRTSPSALWSYRRPRSVGMGMGMSMGLQRPRFRRALTDPHPYPPSYRGARLVPSGALRRGECNVIGYRQPFQQAQAPPRPWRREFGSMHAARSPHGDVDDLAHFGSMNEFAEGPHALSAERLRYQQQLCSVHAPRQQYDHLHHLNHHHHQQQHSDGLTPGGYSTNSLTSVTEAVPLGSAAQVASPPQWQAQPIMHMPHARRYPQHLDPLSQQQQQQMQHALRGSAAIALPQAARQAEGARCEMEQQSVRVPQHLPMLSPSTTKDQTEKKADASEKQDERSPVTSSEPPPKQQVVLGAQVSQGVNGTASTSSSNKNAQKEAPSREGGGSSTETRRSPRTPRRASAAAASAAIRVRMRMEEEDEEEEDEDEDEEEEEEEYEDGDGGEFTESGHSGLPNGVGNSKRQRKSQEGQQNQPQHEQNQGKMQLPLQNPDAAQQQGQNGAPTEQCMHVNSKEGNLLNGGSSNRAFKAVRKTLGTRRNHSGLDGAMLSLSGGSGHVDDGKSKGRNGKGSRANGTSSAATAAAAKRARALEQKRAARAARAPAAVDDAWDSVHSHSSRGTVGHDNDDGVSAQPEGPHAQAVPHAADPAAAKPAGAGSVGVTGNANAATTTQKQGPAAAAAASVDDAPQTQARSGKKRNAGETEAAAEDATKRRRQRAQGSSGKEDESEQDEQKASGKGKNGTPRRQRQRKVQAKEAAESGAHEKTGESNGPSQAHSHESSDLTWSNVREDPALLDGEVTVHVHVDDGEETEEDRSRAPRGNRRGKGRGAGRGGRGRTRTRGRGRGRGAGRAGRAAAAAAHSPGPPRQDVQAPQQRLGPTLALPQPIQSLDTIGPLPVGGNGDGLGETENGVGHDMLDLSFQRSCQRQAQSQQQQQQQQQPQQQQQAGGARDADHVRLELHTPALAPLQQGNPDSHGDHDLDDLFAPCARELLPHQQPQSQMHASAHDILSPISRGCLPDADVGEKLLMHDASQQQHNALSGEGARSLLSVDDTCEWSQYLDFSRQCYYYHNARTQETTWNEPERFIPWPRIAAELQRHVALLDHHQHHHHHQEPVSQASA